MELRATSAMTARVAAPGGFASLLRKSLSAHGLYLAVLAVYYAGYFVVRHRYPDFAAADFLVMALGFVLFSAPVMLLGLGLMRFYYIARYVRPERPVPALIADLKAFFTDHGRLAQGLPMVVIMVVFMRAFTDFKANIALINPYSWDTTFAAADKAIHLGYQPWELLQPILGYAPITFLINLNYGFWLAVMWMVWIYFGFAREASELRTRFFFTFFTVWAIAGTVLAIIFSSVGPCFYGRLGLTPDPYAPLMAYLNHANEVLPIFSIPVQDMLWHSLQGNSFIDGVSAMPSLHNGTALLLVLAGFKVSRTMGWILFAHAVLIFLGSVHLGWHYAVDTYVAWAVVIPLWALSAPVARWWHQGAAQSEFSDALAARK